MPSAMNNRNTLFGDGWQKGVTEESVVLPEINGVTVETISEGNL